MMNLKPMPPPRTGRYLAYAPTGDVMKPMIQAHTWDQRKGHGWTTLNKSMGERVTHWDEIELPRQEKG